MSAPSKPSPKRSIELGQDMEFQQRNWKVQRVSWILLTLALLAAFAGFWGSGRASHRTVTAADGSFAIEYERFTRFKAPTRLRLHFTPKAVHGGEVRVWLASSYVAEIFPRYVVPTPRAVEAGEHRVTYVFAAEAGRGGSVIFDVQPQGIGSVEARVGVGETALEFRQFVYP
jgi:hypothetical protein